MTGVGYSDLLAALAPETALVLAAVAVLFVDMGLMRSAPLRQRFLTACAVAGLGCLVTLGILASSGAHLRFLDGVLVVDSLTQWVKVFLVVLTLFTRASRRRRSSPSMWASISRSCCSPRWE